MKKDSLPVFVIGMVLTLAVFVPISYFLLSQPSPVIVISSAFVIFLWLNGFRVARRRKAGESRL